MSSTNPLWQGNTVLYNPTQNCERRIFNSLTFLLFFFFSGFIFKASLLSRTSRTFMHFAYGSQLHVIWAIILSKTYCLHYFKTWQIKLPELNCLFRCSGPEGNMYAREHVNCSVLQLRYSVTFRRQKAKDY